MIAAGVAWVWPPAGLIVGGIILVILAQGVSTDDTDAKGTKRDN